MFGRLRSTAPGAAVARWQGIRFHLLLAAALLVAVALAIGLASAEIAKHGRTLHAAQDSLLTAAVQASRAAFSRSEQLSARLAEMARTRPDFAREQEHAAVRRALAAIRQQLGEVSDGLHRLESASATSGWAPETGPAHEVASQLRQAARAMVTLELAARDLDAAGGARTAAGIALDTRMQRLQDRYSRHFEACSRVEVTMRSLTSRALAVDLPEAAANGRLQARIDDLLELELGWIATAQDLLTDSRALMTAARELAREPDPAALGAAERQLEVLVKRLQVYRRLPDIAARRPLHEATAAYAEAATAMPTLASLRRTQLDAEARVAAVLRTALATQETLSGILYGLDQAIGSHGRDLIDAQEQRSQVQQRLLQGLALGAGFLALGLISVYLVRRVVRPLERLTAAMQRSSRRITRDASSGIGPDDVPDLGQRSDEVGVMAAALRILHQALADREKSLLAHQARLEHLATHDALTGLPNRAGFTDEIDAALVRARRSGSLLAVGLLDLDGFKTVNDCYGHAAGDSLLRAAARRLQQRVRAPDTVARIGGDELAVLLQGLQDPLEAERRFAAIGAALSEPFRLDAGVEVRVGASVGYTLFPDDDSVGDGLLRHADEAMYQVKHTGKGQVQRYEPEAARVGDALRLQRERLRIALDQDELFLVYQPIADLRSGRIVAAEALLRWNHPERGVLGPDQVLRPVLGSTLTARIGSWVLATAMAQVARWQATGLGLVVGVNLSAEQLRGERLVAEVREELRRCNERLPRSVAGTSAPLQLEVVETEALDGLEQVAEIIAACRNAGARVALDDFGTGYSSLTHFRRLPVDTIKIDRSFVAGMLHNPEDRSIVEAIIALARSMDRAVVAEGVETEAQIEALLALGCHLMQGYGIAMPMAAEACTEWLEAREMAWTAADPNPSGHKAERMH